MQKKVTKNCALCNKEMVNVDCKTKYCSDCRIIMIEKYKAKDKLKRKKQKIKELKLGPKYPQIICQHCRTMIQLSFNPIEDITSLSKLRCINDKCQKLVQNNLVD